MQPQDDGSEEFDPIRMGHSPHETVRLQTIRQMMNLFYKLKFDVPYLMKASFRDVKSGRVINQSKKMEYKFHKIALDDGRFWFEITVGFETFGGTDRVAVVGRLVDLLYQEPTYPDDPWQRFVSELKKYNDV